jgi:hypothetical protein
VSARFSQPVRPSLIVLAKNGIEVHERHKKARKKNGLRKIAGSPAGSMTGESQAFHFVSFGVFRGPSIAGYRLRARRAGLGITGLAGGHFPMGPSVPRIVYAGYFIGATPNSSRNFAADCGNSVPSCFPVPGTPGES